MRPRMLCSEGGIDSSGSGWASWEENDWKSSSTRRTGSPGPHLHRRYRWHHRHGAALKARRLKAEHDLRLIVIDYLRLMQGRSSKNSDNRQQEISEISRSLKALARELNVPVIALSQLSRGGRSRQVKKPMLSDLRESGSLEQDADIVMFLYREDYYDPETEHKNITDVIIAKHRNSPVDTVQLFFHKQFTKFADLSRISLSPAKLFLYRVLPDSSYFLLTKEYLVVNIKV